MNHTTFTNAYISLKQSEIFKIIFVNAMLAVGVIVNLKVLFVILKLPARRRKRPSSVLVAHLSIVTICFAIFCSILVADTQNLITLKGFGACEALSVIKKVLLGAFSMNAFAIVFERFQKFNCFNRGKLILHRLIFLIWSVAIVLALPSVFTEEYRKDRVATYSSSGKKCEPILLMGSLTATLLFEIVHLLVFHCFVICYMIYAMCKIKASLTQLYLLQPIPYQNTQRKVQRIRFLYLHFISFIFMWLPTGVLTVVEQIIKRTEQIDKFPAIHILRNCVGIIVYAYMLLNPLVYLWLMPAKKSTIQSTNNESDLQRNAIRERNEQHPAERKMRKVKAKGTRLDFSERSSTELSRVSTCAFSPAASIVIPNSEPRYRTTSV